MQKTDECDYERQTPAKDDSTEKSMVVDIACPDMKLENSETPEVTKPPNPFAEATRIPNEEESKKAEIDPKLTRNYADASQTMKHHLHVCLKFVSLMYRHYEERIKSTNIEDFEKDEQYLQVVMLNSSLLKALHVCESFQAHCVREYPEVSFDFDDPLTSFDGTLTTIYEGEDLSARDQSGSLEIPKGILAELTSLREVQQQAEAELKQTREKVKKMEEEREEAKEREQELVGQLEKLKQQERHSEQIEVAPGIVVSCERDDDTVSITNAELQRFASIMQNLTSAVEIAREQEAASKLREERLAQEMSETFIILADATSNRNGTGNTIKGGNTTKINARNGGNLADQVRALAEEKDRFATECRKAKQVAGLKRKQDDKTSVLEMKCRDFEMRYKNLSQKFVDLAHRRNPGQTTAKRRSLSARKDDLNGVISHPSTADLNDSIVSAVSAGASVAGDETPTIPDREDRQRTSNTNSRAPSKNNSTKMLLSPSEPSLKRPPMAKSSMIPRLRSSSCGRSEETTFDKAMRRATTKQFATSKIRSSSTGSSPGTGFEPPIRTHVTPTPQLTRPPMNLPIRNFTNLSTRTSFQDAPQIVKPLASWPSRCSWPAARS